MVEKELTVNETTARKLIQLVKGKNIAEISITRGNTHITVKQKPGKARLIVPTPRPDEDQGRESPEEFNPQKEIATEQKDTTIIKSELIGTFHYGIKDVRLAIEGKTYEKGAKMGVVRAMKLDNELKAANKCVLRKILVPDNGIVEYGKPLFEVELL